MALSIADLKAKQASLLSKIKTKVESNGNSYADERFWEPVFDKEKGGGAVIRFLPSPDGPDAMPFAKVITHFFQGENGKYYVENSLRSLDKSDPVSSLNYRLWNTDIKSNQEQSKRQKQKPRWYCNILVEKDVANPDNEGKVFLYKFGPAVWNLIYEQLFPNDPTEPDKAAVNPFDAFEAPSLTLKLLPQKLGNNIVPSYDKSSFSESMKPISKDEQEIADIINKGYSLKEFSSEEFFKSYNELAKKLVEVLGPTTGTGIETVEESLEETKTVTSKEPVIDSIADDGDIVDMTAEDESDDIAALKKLISEGT